VLALGLRLGPVGLENYGIEAGTVAKASKPYQSNRHPRERGDPFGFESRLAAGFQASLGTPCLPLCDQFPQDKVQNSHRLEVINLHGRYHPGTAPLKLKLSRHQGRAAVTSKVCPGRRLSRCPRLSSTGRARHPNIKPPTFLSVNKLPAEERPSHPGWKRGSAQSSPR